MNVVDFGRQLVETEDLDPVYVTLYNAKLWDQPSPYAPYKLEKWLLAYWCFYHCGTASWIVDQRDYWKAMTVAAGSSAYPRGTERRHFRADNALNSVAWLRGDNFGDRAWRLFSEFKSSCPLSVVMAYVQRWKGFGPWIAFKVADMLERLGLCSISFGEADTFLFDSPREGASLVVQHYANGEHVEKAQEPSWAFRYLEKHLGSLESPPRYERTLNGQEYETILCKWKSHLNGHYEVGHDIHEIRKGLLKYSRWPTAQLLLKHVPKVPS